MPPARAYTVVTRGASMTTPRFLAVCAVLAAFAAFPGRTPAEEDENTEEAASQDSDQAPTTTTTTTEAAAPAMDEPAPKPNFRRQRHAKPRALPRNPEDRGGGGGGGGGAVPRQRPQDPDEGENTYEEPQVPQGKPSMDCDLPPLHHINVHIRGGNGNRMIADATPIVCSTDKGTKHERYCQETMGDDNRNCCPAKPEGHPLRLACEIVLLGKDSDGVAGPRWQYVGKAPDSWVDKREDNPFLAFAYGSGIARACSNVVKVCGEASYKVK